MDHDHAFRRERLAIVTGGSRGLGRALVARLVERGWRIIVDARDGDRLDRAVQGLAVPERVTAIPGDVADPDHRRAVAAAAAVTGGLDLLVNNASALGPSPQPALSDYPLDALGRVVAVNALAPLALVQAVLPLLAARRGRVINVSSDAAAEAYPGWGGYGASKAALEHLSATLAAEHPELLVYAFDPGDMATDMHQRAFPGEDISDRPAPEAVVPALRRLIEGELPSGRYRAADRTAVPA